MTQNPTLQLLGAVIAQLTEPLPPPAKAATNPAIPPSAPQN
ncbi:hypothetical protein [Neosynechococcus sphagnicola]|nr:hypothetical protein [Neosynechococcus sphagnicola]